MIATNPINPWKQKCNTTILKVKIKVFSNRQIHQYYITLIFFSYSNQKRRIYKFSYIYIFNVKYLLNLNIC